MSREEIYDEHRWRVWASALDARIPFPFEAALCQHEALDLANRHARVSASRRFRRRTLMDPPPRDPTTRAKGSPLLRPDRRAFLQPCGRGRGPTQCGARNRTMTAKRDLKSII